MESLVKKENYNLSSQLIITHDAKKGLTKRDSREYIVP